jgi:hypothetical protein
MTDIFAHWKVNRFVVVPPEHNNSSRHLIVLTDIPFWTKHADQLDEWCWLHDCVLQGMTVEIPSDPTLTLFHLQWQ